MIFSLLQSIRSPTTVDFLIFGKVTTTGAACAGRFECVTRVNCSIAIPVRVHLQCICAKEKRYVCHIVISYSGSVPSRVHC